MSNASLTLRITTSNEDTASIRRILDSVRV